MRVVNEYPLFASQKNSKIGHVQTLEKVAFLSSCGASKSSCAVAGALKF
nr:MAG TPA: hypothetical protein [Caudoviricetes sp.]